MTAATFAHVRDRARARDAAERRQRIAEHHAPIILDADHRRRFCLAIIRGLEAPACREYPTATPNPRRPRV